MLSFHRGSVAEALSYLFSEVDWDHSKFSSSADVKGNLQIREEN